MTLSSSLIARKTCSNLDIFLSEIFTAKQELDKLEAKIAELEKEYLAACEKKLPDEVNSGFSGFDVKKDYYTLLDEELAAKNELDATRKELQNMQAALAKTCCQFVKPQEREKLAALLEPDNTN